MIVVHYLELLKITVLPEIGDIESFGCRWLSSKSGTCSDVRELIAPVRELCFGEHSWVAETIVQTQARL
jgi:hypothetical protein